MRKKIVGIVIFMLVATTVASATQVDVTKTIETKPSGEVSLWKTNIGTSSEDALFDWWCVDQKQTQQDGYGWTLEPPSIYAQSFTPTKDKLTAVSLYIFKAGTPLDPVHISVSIKDNLTGSDLATKTIDTSVVTIGNKGKWVLFDFEDFSITPESTYYIMCSGDAGDATNAYCWFFSDNDTYTRGEGWIKFSETSQWVTLEQAGSGADFCFKTYFRKPIDVSSTLKTNENMAPADYGVDVPVWTVGDTWVYNNRATEHRYLQNGTLWFLLYRNVTETWEVTDETGENYTLKMTSTNMEGSVTIGKFRLKFTPRTKFSCDFSFRKTDLADLGESWQEKGLVFWLLGKSGIPIPAQYKRTWEYDWGGAVILPFPLNAGTNGTLPGYSYTAQSKCSLYWGLIPLFDNPVASYSASPEHYHCEMAEITVPAGSFNAYNVSVDRQYGAGHSQVWRYYVPEVGFLGKQYFDIDYDTSGKPYSHYEVELVSTTYTP